jgi:hypothetical protein
LFLSKSIDKRTVFRKPRKDRDDELKSAGRGKAVEPSPEAEAKKEKKVEAVAGK